MLDAAVLSQLSGHFEKLVYPVELVLSADETATSAQLRELLEEISALSAQIVLLEQPGERVPAFEIRRAGEAAVSVTFAGVPMGHEFSSFVLAVLQVGGHPAKLPDQLIEQIRELEGPLAFETFFSQSCQNCPDVVQALNLLSVLNPDISHVAIDGASFQDEVARRGVQSVPAVFLNGELFGFGRMTVEEIVSRLDTSSLARERERLDQAETFDVLVIGAGPAGAAAAVYAARKGVRTGIVADRVGGQVLDTMSIENMISVPHTEGPALARALESHVRGYDVDMMVPQRAAKLIPGDGEQPARVELENGAALTARAVVLSPGARWRTMGVPGEDEYRNKGVTFCPHCDGPLFKGKRVAVVGGGNSGVEAAIDLAGLASHVTLIEFGSELRADAVLQRALSALENVTVITNAQTTEVLGNGSAVTGLSYLDRRDANLQHIDVDGVFVQIGLLPNTDWLRGAVELSDRGEIVVDDKGATSAPGVFAAGDATTVPYKQIIIATGSGATAALGAFDHLIRTPQPAVAAAA